MDRYRSTAVADAELYVVRAFRTVGLAIQENVWLIWFEGSGCDCLLMQAASLLDGFSFDLFPPFENDLAAPEVDVSRRQVVQALVVSTVVVVADELLDALFELSWQVVVVQQDPVFHRAMISLDLALRHRVVRPAADMSDAVVLEPLAKLARHVGWTVIAQQPWPMQNCMSSEHFGQSAWQFKRMSGSSGLKVQAAIAC